jgi:hypothetical protein
MESGDRDPKNGVGKGALSLSVVTIILGVLGLFPFGLCKLAFASGFVPDLSMFEPTEVGLLVFGIGALIAVSIFGLSKSSDTRTVIRYFLIALVLLNLGGCAMIWSELGQIH